MKLALILLAALLAVSTAAIGAPGQTGPSVAVQTAALRKGSLPRVVTAYGMVGAAPAARQTIQAPVASVIDTVYVKPGQQVDAETPLLRLGPSPETASAYTQARTALRTANGDVTRTRSLLAQHFATNQQLATAEKAAADARAALAALQAEGAGSPQTMRAPFAAIVTTLSASPGAIVAQGAPLLELARPTQLVLHAGAMPAQAVRISNGNPAKIAPLGEGRSAEGQVVLVDSVVDPKTGLVPVDIALPVGRFFAGEMAQADIEVGKAEGYLVPHEAVLVNDRGAPYVVQAVAGRAKQVPVELLLGAGATDVVSGALDPAAPLVLAGNYQLTKGMRLRVDPPGPAK